MFFRLLLAEAAQQQNNVTFLKTKLSAIENAQQNIEAYQEKESIASQKYPKLEEQYIQVKKADELLSVYGTCDEL